MSVNFDDIGYIRRVFVDASALVRYLLADAGVAAEPGGKEIRCYISRPERLPYTNNPCLAETLTVLKRKWLKEKITWEGYQMAVYILKSMVDGGRLKVSEFNFWERRFSDRALEIARKYEIDFLDAVQIVDIKDGPYKIFVGESEPLLITTDCKLGEAAREELVPVWDPLKEGFPD